LTLWEFWWGFNKDQYLNLKAAIHSGPITGSDEFFLSQGKGKEARNTLKPSEVAIRTKIVPALKEALEKETNNDIVTGSLVALAKIGDVKTEEGVSEFEGIITKFLADPNQEIAETAAVALGILANDASVKTLESLVHDAPEGRKLVGSATEVKYRTRAFSTYGLGLIGYRTASDSVRQEIAGILIELLKKPEGSTRDVKVAALIALGLVPIDVDKSESPDSNPSATASRQGQIKFIIKFFEDQNNHYLIRAHAPTALARLLKDCPPDLEEKVTKLLLDGVGKHSKERDEVQQSCVLAMGMIADADKDKLDVEVRDTLKRLSEEGDQQSKNFTMIALGQIGGRPGEGDANEEGQKDVRSFLLTNLTKGKNHIRPWAGIGIGVMERALLDNSLTPSTTAKDTLRSALKESVSPDQVGAYAIGAGICKDTEAKDILMKKLGEISDVNARGYVAVGLGLMDAREAIKPIQDIVKESKYKPDLLKQAAIGLGLLGDKELVPDLVQMLREAKGLATQAAIASALGFIGDSRSIDPLVEMLKNADITPSARGFAAVALGIVADKEPLPWNSKISTNINYRANTQTLTGEGTGILDIL
jgi:HEAT repeat protein